MEIPLDMERPVAQKLRLGYIGLGKMGFNMVERLLEKGYRPVTFDVNEDATKKTAGLGAEPTASLKSLAGTLLPPRLVWLMVPQETVDHVLEGIVPFLGFGDTIIDGGNSHYKDSMRRAQALTPAGIEFLDVGVSGGPSGARNGACIMVGGKKSVFDGYEDLFRDLSVPGGYEYIGVQGAGHFVKMIHNGIEYGMMQSMAEGFAVMREAPFNLSLTAIASLFSHGSVIASRLTEWLGQAFREYGEGLEAVSGAVAQSGEGMWTVEAGKEYGVSTAGIAAAVQFRAESLTHPSYGGQILSALRNQFGQHDVFRKPREDAA
ncbi:MAG TPA: decarboxylating 6-phosphogluconate dehydrogenase [Syntrophorhabdaceae bacterium]|nr:decarboxylating 6-phosphogluconate dehydrogenase [Syntrophorhabdaceae bacterium]